MGRKKSFVIHRIQVYYNRYDPVRDRFAVYDYSATEMHNEVSSSKYSYHSVNYETPQDISLLSFPRMRESRFLAISLDSPIQGNDKSGGFVIHCKYYGHQKFKK